MAKTQVAWFFLVALLLPACAELFVSDQEYADLNGAPPAVRKRTPNKSPKRKVSIPPWVYSPPRSATEVYVVGEAKDIEQKDDALERAWVSGLIRMGMTQFPELGALRSESFETLHDANYKRQFVMQLEKISWVGLREVEDRGSPVIVPNEES